MKISEVLFENNQSTGVEAGAAGVAQVDISEAKMALVAVGLQSARDLSRGRKNEVSREYVLTSWDAWHPDTPAPLELRQEQA